MVADTAYTLSYLMLLDICPHSSGLVCKVRLPFQEVSSSKLFEQFHDKVVFQGKSFTVMKLTLDWQVEGVGSSSVSSALPMLYACIISQSECFVLNESVGKKTKLSQPRASRPKPKPRRADASEDADVAAILELLAGTTGGEGQGPPDIVQDVLRRLSREHIHRRDGDGGIVDDKYDDLVADDRRLAPAPIARSSKRARTARTDPTAGSSGDGRVSDTSSSCESSDDDASVADEVEPEPEVAVPPDITNVIRDLAVVTWHAAARTGAAVLAQRDATVAAVPLGRSHPWEMSLICYGDTGGAGAGAGAPDRVLSFVHWSNPTTRVGYPITVRNGCAVYPAFVRATKFDGHCMEVVHPAIGVRIRRRGTVVGISFRAEIPESMLQLRSMWEASLGSWNDVLPACFVCGGALSMDDVAHVREEGGEQPRVSFCPLCMLSSHRDCSARVLPLVTTTASLPYFKLPAHFRDRLCCLCLARVPDGAQASMLQV
jgi:hypothetical protein